MLTAKLKSALGNIPFIVYWISSIITRHMKNKRYVILTQKKASSRRLGMMIKLKLFIKDLEKLL